MVFGRRKDSPGTTGPGSRTEPPTPPVDSDGKRRIFGEAVYAEHGDFLRAIGHDINDPGNIVEEQADFDRLVRQSLEKQDQRRTKIMAELLARHGCNNIRPFFLFSEGIYNAPLGDWLIQIMRLMPYDDWNITYLPMDAKTAAAMRLPLHPQQSIPPVEDLVNERLSALWHQFTEARKRAYLRFEESQDMEHLAQFTKGADQMRQAILDWAASITPSIIQLIAEVQSRA